VRRIAFCITELEAGGAEKSLVQLATRMDPTRWHVHVFCLAPPGPFVDDLNAARVPVTCLNAPSVLHLGAIVRLTRRLRAYRPELLQTFLFHANIFGRIAGRLAGVPRICSGIRVAEKDGPWRLWIDRITNRMVDCNVCVSQDVADFSIGTTRLAPDKCVVIPNGVVPAVADTVQPADLTALGIPRDSKTILFVGRLVPQKNPMLLLKAATPLIQRMSNLHVLVVGDGPLAKNVRAWIADHHCESRIHWLGRRTDVPQLLTACDCLALTSDWEGMPNVVLEAMAAGRPVVATRVEGVAELVRDGVNGWTVSRGDWRALQERFKSLLQNPGEMARMGVESQTIALKDFTVIRMVRSYESLYEKLLPSTVTTAQNSP